MAVHDRRDGLTAFVRVIESKDVSELVQRHAMEILHAGPQVAAVRVPRVRGIEDDVALRARRSPRPVRRHGEHARAKRPAVEVVREQHVVDVVAVSLRRRRIADDGELDAADVLIPGGEGRFGRRAPARRSVGQAARRS